MPNSIEWDLPQQVLSDVHRLASGAGATVAVLSDLCNGKSRVCIPGRCHRRPLTDSAALKYGALPASVRVGQGSAIGAGPSPLAVSIWAGGNRHSGLGSTDCRLARASMPFVICSTGDALAFKVALANRTSATCDRRARQGPRSARGSRLNFWGFERLRRATGSLTNSP